MLLIFPTVFNSTAFGSIYSIIGGTYSITLKLIASSILDSFCSIFIVATPSPLKVIKPLLSISKTSVLLEVKLSVL